MVKAARKAWWVCQECGHREPRQSGFCPACRKYNTMVEEVAAAPMFRRGPATQADANGARAQRLGDVALEGTQRITSGVGELDRVLGGGIVPGSLILVGGDPGIGKSTLLLQMAARMEKQESLLYVSGEESLAQVALRAQRLGQGAESAWLLCETRLEAILEEFQRLKPRVCVLDSIQTIYREDIDSAPGSVSQLRECTAALLTWAKTSQSALFLVGHVTKDGQIAGPRVLEHMVDTVLYFEGDRNQQYRLLRSVKNRFGATGEVGVFEMRADGLHGVADASGLFAGDWGKPRPGSAWTAIMEGSRALLCEVQALAVPTHYSMPQRVATGFDMKRLTILLALLERHAGMQLGGLDIFVSVAGGLKLDDPGAELAVALAVASSVRNRPLPSRTAILGELGLGGEVRASSQFDSRLREIRHLGGSSVLAPPRGKHPAPEGLSLREVGDLSQALTAAFD